MRQFPDHVLDRYVLGGVTTISVGGLVTEEEGQHIAACAQDGIRQAVREIKTARLNAILDDLASSLPPASVLSLKPGDVVLYTDPEQKTPAELAFIRKMHAEYFPNNDGIIADGGASVSVVRPEIAARPTPAHSE